MEPTEEVIENEIEKKSIERTIIEEPEPEPPWGGSGATIVAPEPETTKEDRDRSKAPNPNKNDEVAFDKPKRRTKKERSPAQIAAFEKARLKRMEIAKQKRELKAKQKEEDNILKEQIKEKIDNETKPIDIPKQILKKEVVKPRIEQPTPREIVREQVVNNYYYYGEQPKKRGRKKKIVEPEPPWGGSGAAYAAPETESESESEEEYIQQPSRSQERMFRSETPPSPIQQPETYKELQSYKEEAPKKQVVRAQPKLKFSFV